jgi:hypothetical protein
MLHAYLLRKKHTFMQWRTLILTDMGRTYYINTDHPPMTHKHYQSNYNEGNI